MIAGHGEHADAAFAQLRDHAAPVGILAVEGGAVGGVAEDQVAVEEERVRLLLRDLAEDAGEHAGVLQPQAVRAGEVDGLGVLPRVADGGEGEDHGISGGPPDHDDEQGEDAEGEQGADGFHN